MIVYFGNSCRTTSSITPLESTIDTGDLTETTMQLMREDGGSLTSISESSNNVDIGDDLSLALTNGKYVQIIKFNDRPEMFRAMIRLSTFHQLGHACSSAIIPF